MSVLKNIITEKCPKCGEGKVFEKKGNILLFQMPKMNKRCSHCDHQFEKEPGYFFGSMFVSYAVAVAEMVVFFLIIQFFVHSFVTIVVLIAIMSVLLSTFNFRLSRMLWMHLLDGKNKRL
ncbi:MULTISPECIES: DUF983 domain-containing protein [unclassified Flavobacterium]|uniref:DUF983 domain-containing protein n=1 Tax=unclassified Flavobacterium TaxID=196869 RepID=UPI00086C4C19|nr:MULTISPECIES: DUF983 domain-containing protein [unclassified Flavobacterium]MBN9284751.1 DUF983 domain-containing protein [Flavobacterium sp.]ODS77894.1 MAG: DUF983 domain-containing protein [Chryseobacterium sp. SCN 40-13]OJV71253.1 MAG: DUF983 domain-containing protein [Flavobacterium sp. 40-81]